MNLRCFWWQKTLLLILIVPLMNGCIHRLTQKYTTNIMENLSSTLFRQPDPELAKDGGASFLLVIDSHIQTNPQDENALLAGLKGYTAYSSAFLLEDEPDRAYILYDYALNYGFRMIQQRFNNADFKQLQPDQIQSVLTNATKKDVPAIYWTATAWSGWMITHPDKMLGIADLSKVVTMMKSVLHLDPYYQSGGAHLFFGLYYSSRSRALGGDPDKAQNHFKKAIEISGEELLLPKVLYAQYYARMTFNKKLYVKTLQSVLNKSTWLNPDYNLMNAIAKQRAEKLLKLTDEYF